MFAWQRRGAFGRSLPAAAGVFCRTLPVEVGQGREALDQGGLLQCGFVPSSGRPAQVSGEWARRGVQVVVVGGRGDEGGGGGRGACLESDRAGAEGTGGEGALGDGPASVAPRPARVSCGTTRETAGAGRPGSSPRPRARAPPGSPASMGRLHGRLLVGRLKAPSSS